MAKIYLDLETHQTVSEEEIARRYFYERSNAKYGWVKFYPKTMGLLTRAVNNSRYDVVAHIFQSVNIVTNEFTGSVKAIVEKTGAAESTVVRVLKSLQEDDILRPIVNSHWMLNPALFYTGHEGKNRFLLEKYLGLDRRHVKKQDDVSADQSELVARVEALIEGVGGYDN